MPSLPTLDQLYHRAVEFPDPTARFNSLAIAFSATEDALAHQAAQHQLRGHRAIQHGEAHPEDVELTLYELRKTADEVFPRVFRGGFLVSLWSLFESGVKDLGEYTRSKLLLPFGLQELRAGDFLDQMEKYFRKTLEITVFDDKETRKQIELIKSFRNALAHHDGNLSEIPKALLNARTMDAPCVQLFSDLHHEFGIPTAEYNASSLNVLSAVSSSLAKKVYAKLHPTNSEA